MMTTSLPVKQFNYTLPPKLYMYGKWSKWTWIEPKGFAEMGSTSPTTCDLLNIACVVGMEQK